MSKSSNLMKALALKTISGDSAGAADERDLVRITNDILKQLNGYENAGKNDNMQEREVDILSLDYIFDWWKTVNHNSAIGSTEVWLAPESITKIKNTVMVIFKTPSGSAAVGELPSLQIKYKSLSPKMSDLIAKNNNKTLLLDFKGI